MKKLVDWVLFGFGLVSMHCSGSFEEEGEAGLCTVVLVLKS
jgi:hypothetical protein